MKIYGPSDKRAQLEPKLLWATSGRGFPKANAPGPASHPVPATPVRSRAPPGIPTAPQVAGPSSSQSRVAYTAAQQEAARKQLEASAKAAELSQILNSLEKVDDEARRGSLLDTLCSTDDVMNLPLHPAPPGIQTGELKVDLLKHQVCRCRCGGLFSFFKDVSQSQALQWCVEHEYPVLPKQETDKPVQFWQLRKMGAKVLPLIVLLYALPKISFNGSHTIIIVSSQRARYNLILILNNAVATNTPPEIAPVLGRGALCADSMGLVRGTLYTALAILASPYHIREKLSQCLHSFSPRRPMFRPISLNLH